MIHRMTGIKSQGIPVLLNHFDSTSRESQQDIILVVSEQPHR